MHTVTPPHPLAEKAGALTRDELLEVVRYEGMWGYGPQDLPAAEQLEREGLVELDHVGDQPVIVNLATQGSRRGRPSAVAA